MKTLSIIIILLLVNMFLGCSEWCPDPVVRQPYYDTLDELHDEHFNFWQPYRPRPGYNKATYIFTENP